MWLLNLLIIWQIRSRVFENENHQQVLKPGSPGQKSLTCVLRMFKCPSATCLLKSSSGGRVFSTYSICGAACENPSHCETDIFYYKYSSENRRLSWMETFLFVYLLHARGYPAKVSMEKFPFWPHPRSITDILTAGVWLQTELIRLTMALLWRIAIQRLAQHVAFHVS